MTILVTITNEDQDTQRGLEVVRDKAVIATLCPGQSTSHHVWRDAPLTIREFQAQGRK